MVRYLCFIYDFQWAFSPPPPSLILLPPERSWALLLWLLIFYVPFPFCDLILSLLCKIQHLTYSAWNGHGQIIPLDAIYALQKICNKCIIWCMFVSKSQCHIHILYFQMYPAAVLGFDMKSKCMKQPFN